MDVIKEQILESILRDILNFDTINSIYILNDCKESIDIIKEIKLKDFMKKYKKFNDILEEIMVKLATRVFNIKTLILHNNWTGGWPGVRLKITYSLCGPEELVKNKKDNIKEIELLFIENYILNNIDLFEIINGDEPQRINDNDNDNNKSELLNAINKKNYCWIDNYEYSY
jgi:hypothetical protein